MTRAKYSSDPRPCPACKRKRLYRRQVAIGNPIPLGEPFGVQADVCSACKGRFFKGEPLDDALVKARALLAEARQNERLARAHENNAADLRRASEALARAAFTKAQKDLE